MSHQHSNKMLQLNWARSSGAPVTRHSRAVVQSQHVRQSAPDSRKFQTVSLRPNIKEGYGDGANGFWCAEMLNDWQRWPSPFSSSLRLIRPSVLCRSLQSLSISYFEDSAPSLDFSLFASTITTDDILMRLKAAALAFKQHSITYTIIHKLLKFVF